MSLHEKADLMLRELNRFSKSPDFPQGDFAALSALDRTITSLGALKAALPAPNPAKVLTVSAKSV